MIQFINNLSTGRGPLTNVPPGTPAISGLTDKIIVQHNPVPLDGGWYGRSMVQELPGGITMLTYNEGYTHPDPTYEQHHIRFSNDYGATWSDEDKYLDGSDITGFPMWPIGAEPGVTRGTSECYPILCPNGDLINQMWSSDYSTDNDGTHQSRSTDGGRTWSTPEKITTVAGFDGPDINTMLNGEQTMVVGNRIYVCMRDYRNPFGNFQNNLVIYSDDNGYTWSQLGRVTNTSTSGEGGKEMSICYVGGNRMVGLIRWFPNDSAYRAESNDMGVTWTVTEDATLVPANTGLGRTMIYTRSQLQGRNRWWEDPLLICCGFVHTTGGQSKPRRNAIWVSKDKGENWTGPLFLEDAIDQDDGGYGDMFYNPLTDEYVVCMYMAPTGFRDASVKQYNFTLTFL